MESTELAKMFKKFVTEIWDFEKSAALTHELMGQDMPHVPTNPNFFYRNNAIDKSITI